MKHEIKYLKKDHSTKSNSTLYMRILPDNRLETITINDATGEISCDLSSCYVSKVVVTDNNLHELYLERYASGPRGKSLSTASMYVDVHNSTEQEYLIALGVL